MNKIIFSLFACFFLVASVLAIESSASAADSTTISSTSTSTTTQSRGRCDARYPRPSGTHVSGVYRTNWRCKTISLPNILYNDKYPALAKSTAGSTCSTPNFVEARIATYILDEDEETFIGPVARFKFAVKRCNDDCVKLWEQGYWVNSNNPANYDYDALYDVIEQELSPSSFKGETTTCETFSYNSPTQNTSPNAIVLFPNAWVNTHWESDSNGIFGGNIFVNKRNTAIWNGVGVSYSTNTTLSPHFINVHKWVPVSPSYFPGLQVPMDPDMKDFKHPSLLKRDIGEDFNRVGTFTFPWKGNLYEAPRDILIKPNYDSTQNVRRI